MLIIIILILLSLLISLLIAKKAADFPASSHSQQQGMELQQNEAYIKTPAIPVGANECYGATTSTSVNPDQFYATPTERGVTHTPSQLQESAIEEYDYVT